MDPRPDPAPDWTRTFRVPLALSGVFAVLLVFFALTGEGAGRASDPTTTLAPDSTPASNRCSACGLGERCDERTGMCVLANRTPPPCTEGSSYDEEAGFCLPDETPRPTPPPAATLDPARFATPEPARTPDVEPEPEPENTPPPVTRTPQAPSTPDND